MYDFDDGPPVDTTEWYDINDTDDGAKVGSDLIKPTKFEGAKLGYFSLVEQKA